MVIAPVDRYWELVEMIPTGGVLPIPSDQRLAEGLPLGDHKFDTCFTGLRADSDGLVRTRLLDPASGRTVTQTFDRSFTQCVIYTPPHREAICLEPYTCVPDAARLADEGHETGLQILQPSEFRETTVRIAVNR
jgi:aldose 1-epimerase